MPDGTYQIQGVPPDRPDQKRGKQHAPQGDRDFRRHRNLAAAGDRIGEPFDLGLEPGDLLARRAAGHGTF